VIAIVKAGLLTTIQDLGRLGYAHLGVPRSGALDAPALAGANRLVGNPPAAAGLETTLTGASLRPEATVTVAVCGAPCTVTVDGAPVPFGAAIRVPEGALLDIGPARTGVRSYLAVAGGITVAPILGSRSTDTLSGLGPPPLRPGFVLPVGGPPAGPDAASENHVDGTPMQVDGVSKDVEAPTAGTDIVLRVRLGPRLDWFGAQARATLLAAPYTLTAKSNRVGARLSGPPLIRADNRELPSEGIVLGALQVTADGQPLVFLADHPTTGGYPVIAVVERADLPLLAQARPSAAISFVATSDPGSPAPLGRGGPGADQERLWT
jgi:biotin-dependent carboxylase-like uncharacterized protein